MKKDNPLLSTKPIQYKTLTLLVFAIFGMTAILNSSNPFLFQRFLGKVNPFFAILFSGIAGFLLLSFLLYKNWFDIFKKESLTSSFRYASWVLLFTAIAIFVDWKVVYPKDMNILFPESLLFYPVIAFFVEIVFHVFPLAIVLFFMTAFLKEKNHERLMRISIFVIATFEPTYQVFFMDVFPLWSLVVVWINLFLFNLTQLAVFWKYDFISMYAFRLIYYLIWHMLWGYFRLDILREYF